MNASLKSVLIVEDDEATMELETRVLSRMGLNVCTASTGADAIRALNAQIFSIVLLDHKLPDGASWPVLDAALHDRTRIPVIVVTAMGDERVAAEAIHRGAAEYVVKTGNFWEQLPFLVERAIERTEVDRARTHLASIVEFWPDAIVSITPDGTIQSWNAAATQMYGFSPKEAIGANVSILSAIEISNDLPEILKRLNRGEIISKLDTKRVGRDGKQIDLSLTISPIKDERGRAVGLSMIAHNFTERKARQIAEEANSAKSAFLANMSHEIRTPMSAIIGFNYLMQQTSMTIRQSKYAANIAQASNSLLTLINDILNLAKVEAGKIELEAIEFELEEVLSQLVQVTTPLIQKKNVTVKIDNASNVPRRLIGDSLRLGQVLLNLSSNAIKFTDSGEVLISVEQLERSDSNVNLLVKVKDCGIGISPAQCLKLFQPFVQADSTTTRKHGGTGLGLAISKQLVNLMQGEIKVESQQGQGSTFSFTARFGVPAQVGTPKRAESVAGVKQHALVIDGNTESRNALSTLLSDLHFKVTACAKCPEALVEIGKSENGSKTDFNLILVDASETGKDWLTDVIRIREKFGSRLSPPIILIADKTAGELEMDCKALGLNDIVLKPLTGSALYDSIVRIRSRQAGRPKSVCQTQKSHSALRGVRILLVEDEEINQQVATAILDIVGCEVTVASNGVEALQKVFDAAAERKFDAVLMDLRMPGMDGIAVTRQIRAEKHLDTLPIIAMTADAVTGVKSTCLAAGMNDYLAKPINPAELFVMLEHWINSKK